VVQVQPKGNQDELRLFTADELELYGEILCFLEKTHASAGIYERKEVSLEKPMDVLLLNFAKVVSDSRAILLLAESGFYAQAGIVVRSADEASSMMMHVSFAGEKATLVPRWLAGERLSRWKRLRELDEQVRGLDLDSYARVARNLDDFVHANYRALRFYPAQLLGPTPLDSDAFHGLTFWKRLVRLHLFSCLLVVPQILPRSEKQAEEYIDRLLGKSGKVLSEE